MNAVIDRSTGRAAFLVFACAFTLAGFGGAMILRPVPNAQLLLIPLAALACSIVAAQLRIDNSEWRVDAPFLALTFAVLGPWGAIFTSLATGLSASFIRRGTISYERDWRGPAALALACAVGYIFTPFGAAAASVTFCLAWRVIRLGLENRPFVPPAHVLVPAGISLAIGGLFDAGYFVEIFVAILPVGLYALMAYKQEASERAHREILQALALMLQRAHPYTHSHIERVACIAESTARKLGLSPQRSKLIHDAARLHDIGKIAVDEQVLDKPGKLTPDEFEHVKQHAPFGASILEEVEELRGIADWIRYHHERPDGTGYPKGLKDDSIPIEAKIIAVADAFDAMTSGFEGGEKRTYRDPLSPEDALAEMERCAGTQFDRAVVDAFRIAMTEESLP